MIRVQLHHENHNTTHTGARTHTNQVCLFIYLFFREFVAKHLPAHPKERRKKYVKKKKRGEIKERERKKSVFGSGRRKRQVKLS